MPLFAVDIEKYLDGEYWTNRYIIQDADLAQGVVTANIIYEAERQIHKTPVLFTKLRVSDQVPNTDVYQVVNKNTNGLLAVSSELLPLFVVIRVDFNPTGGGRPSRKYLRTPTQESENMGAGALNPVTIDHINTNYVQPLVDLVAYVDVDNQALTSGSVYPFFAMRQLRRGSKRRLQPIL